MPIHVHSIQIVVHRIASVTIGLGVRVFNCPTETRICWPTHIKNFDSGAFGGRSDQVHSQHVSDQIRKWLWLHSHGSSYILHGEMEENCHILEFLQPIFHKEIIMHVLECQNQIPVIIWHQSSQHKTAPAPVLHARIILCVTDQTTSSTFEITSSVLTTWPDVLRCDSLLTLGILMQEMVLRPDQTLPVVIILAFSQGFSVSNSAWEWQHSTPWQQSGHLPLSQSRVPTNQNSQKSLPSRYL